MVLARAASTRRALPSGSCPLCFGSGRLPATGRGAPRPVVLGSSIGLEPLELAAAVLLGASGLPERGEEGRSCHELIAHGLQPSSLAE